MLELRKSLCSLLKQLHGRDERISFCPPGHWLSATATALAQTAPLHTIEVEEFKIGEVASMFPKASKLIELLKTVPFVLPFDLRAKLFQSLIEHDRGGRDPHGGVFNAGNVFVDIRRAQLYVVSLQYTIFTFDFWGCHSLPSSSLFGTRIPLRYTYRLSRTSCRTHSTSPRPAATKTHLTSSMGWGLGCGRSCGCGCSTTKGSKRPALMEVASSESFWPR